MSNEDFEIDYENCPYRARYGSVFCCTLSDTDCAYFGMKRKITDISGAFDALPECLYFKFPKKEGPTLADFVEI